MKSVVFSLIFAAAGFAAVPSGPDTGAKMPNFAASDQNGAPHKLYDLLGPKGAVLVVYRSADW